MYRKILSGVLVNLPGWRTRRKIVVIESDDWGSIRMPSREIYEKCLKAGYSVDKISYERYDSLASEDDLELLFDLLTSFRDQNGNHPVITANCVVANPDFNKIKSDNFNTYHFELITETFKKYPKHANSMNLWRQGMSSKIFFPQYHCREHLNVSLFMDALKNGNKDVHFGFKNKMPGSIPKEMWTRGNEYVEALNYSSEEDKKEKLDIFLEGLDLFEGLFGFKSESIIPPNYIWSPDFNSYVSKKGIKYFQGLRKMSEPNPGGKAKYTNHYLGQRNEFGQTYLIRNASFEPSLFENKIQDTLKNCLLRMEIAFKMQKPAIISSHRINYIGFIDESNRDRSLKLLSELLSSALKSWPDIEFLTSNQLGNIINTSQEKLLFL